MSTFSYVKLFIYSIFIFSLGKKLLKNDIRFAAFEEKLFENGYIDSDYRFTDKHGYKNELAQIYHHLISKRYFHPILFPEKLPITNLQIRKFLDHRYSTNIDRQFRNYSEKPTVIADFIESHYWLSNLPSC